MSASQVDPTKVSHPELASFTRQLGSMLHAGVNVLRALRIASQYSGNGPLIDASVSISRSLEDGREFHQAIARHPELFGAFYVEMARQGETDGMLGQALLGVADYLDHLSTGPSPSTVPDVAVVTTQSAPSHVATTVMMTLGVLALGAAAVGSLAAFRMLDERWLPPVAAAWAGFCLIAGGWLLRRVTPVTPPAPPPKMPGLPPKSHQRRAAETDGIVRSALQEQAEEEELQSQRAASEASANSRNGRNPIVGELLLPPDERTPPRFDL